ncbi:MAG: tetratricopeptide repeat protein, partial [Gimesia chilikensis]
YSLPDPSGTPDCSDWWGMLTGSPNLKPALLQAQTFRAMQLYTAALRVLHPLLQHYDSPEVKREFELCQKELAYQEQLDTGAPSQLRLQAYQQTSPTDAFPLAQAGPGFQGDHSPPAAVSETLARAINEYIHGDCSEAIAALTADDSESLYAKAQIQLESGDPANAASTFRQLIEQHPQDRLVVPSQNMLDALQ